MPNQNELVPNEQEIYAATDIDTDPHAGVYINSRKIAKHIRHFSGPDDKVGKSASELAGELEEWKRRTEENFNNWSNKAGDALRWMERAEQAESELAKAKESIRIADGIIQYGVGDCVMKREYLASRQPPQPSTKQKERQG